MLAPSAWPGVLTATPVPTLDLAAEILLSTHAAEERYHLILLHRSESTILSTLRSHVSFTTTLPLYRPSVSRSSTYDRFTLEAILLKQFFSIFSPGAHARCIFPGCYNDLSCTLFKPRPGRRGHSLFCMSVRIYSSSWNVVTRPMSSLNCMSPILQHK